MKTHLKANVQLISDMHFRGRNPEGLGVEMDSRPEGEPAAGPTPMELVLQAAGGCSLMDVAAILRKQRLNLDKLEMQLEGVKEENHPHSFKEINIIYRARGEGLTLDKLTTAAELSITKYCSVFGMLKKAAVVNWKCELID